METNRRHMIMTAGVLAGVGVAAGLGEHEHQRETPHESGDLAMGRAPKGPLRGVHVHVARPGLVPGRPVDLRAPALPYGDLETGDGGPVGSFDTSRLESGRQPLHLQTLLLHTGSIVGLGPATYEGTFTIVGSGVSGSYTVSATGSDSLEFTFDTGREA
jgi:hypothetical protein